MKKIACLLACCCLLSLGTITAFAEEAAVQVSEQQITLTETQTTFEASIEVEPEEAYAGVEIGIACPEGVTVTDSASSSGSMSAGPVVANGLYWTSFFEADNKLSGTMEITSQFSCTESFESGDVLLARVRVLTKEGVSVVTEEQTPAVKLSLTRDGSETIESDGVADNSSQPIADSDAAADSDTAYGSGAANDSDTAADSDTVTDSDAAADSEEASDSNTSADSNSDKNNTEPAGNGSDAEVDSTPETGNNGLLLAGAALLFLAACAALAIGVVVKRKN